MVSVIYGAIVQALVSGASLGLGVAGIQLRCHVPGNRGILMQQREGHLLWIWPGWGALSMTPQYRALRSITTCENEATREQMRLEY